MAAARPLDPSGRGELASNPFAALFALTRTAVHFTGIPPLAGLSNSLWCALRSLGVRKRSMRRVHALRAVQITFHPRNATPKHQSLRGCCPHQPQ